MSGEVDLIGQAVIMSAPSILVIVVSLALRIVRTIVRSASRKGGLR